MGKELNLMQSGNGKWFFEDADGDLYGPYDTKQTALDNYDELEAKQVERATALMEDCECPRCSGHPEEE